MRTLGLIVKRLGARRLLDVGTGSGQSQFGASNLILDHLKSDSLEITACGLQDLGPIRDRHPHVSFVQANATALPFLDASFDIAHSNAVIEHVIGDEARRHMLAEMLRVARVAFVTTPNKCFPIEVHSRMPIIHWLPRSAHNQLLRLIGLQALSRGSYFEPLTAAQLRDLFPKGSHVRIIYPDPLRMTVVAIGELHPP